MNKGKCKTCGGDEAIHRWDTLQCPLGGREAPYPKKQDWMQTTYEEDTELKDELIADLQKQNADLLNKIRELESVALAFDEKGIGCEKGNFGRLNWLKTLVNLANTRNGIEDSYSADHGATAMMFDEVRELIGELESIKRKDS